MTANTASPKLRVPKALWYAVGLAVLWVVLALVSPTTTYHLAPLLIAGALPVLDAADNAASSATRRILTLAVVGTTLALVATLVLDVSDSLIGPSLLPTGGAVLESVVLSIAGGAIGVAGAVALSRRLG